jgi:putative peptide zinc metalloprotease protein
LGFISEDGTEVQKGDVLARMQYPDMEFQHQQQSRDVKLIEAQLAGSGIASNSSLSRGTLVAQLQAGRKRIQELDSILSDQVLIAPFDGLIRSVNGDLSANQWVAPGERLLTLVNPNMQEIVAYMSEQEYRNLEIGQTGAFYSDGGQIPPAQVELFAIDSLPVDSLDQLYVASTYGGGLSVRDSGDGSLSPQTSTYRLHFLPEVKMPDRIMRGFVTVSSKASSPLARYARNALNVWRRESGF